MKQKAIKRKFGLNKTKSDGKVEDDKSKSALIKSKEIQKKQAANEEEDVIQTLN